MPDHPLITDDTLYRREVGPGGTERYVPVAAIEGERPCERCGGRGREDFYSEATLSYSLGTCPNCGGTGKVREDRLVKLSEVVAFVRSVKSNDLINPEKALADGIEREFGGDR